MNNRNLILRYFGLAILIVGIILNVLMFVNAVWPTYLFFIICFIGIVQICFSYFKKIQAVWQIFWCVIPFALGYGYLQLNSPSKDIYLIPNNYRGKVEIIYGCNDGQKKESEGLWRIYRITENGKLKTEYKLKGESISLSNCKYFYVDKKGNRTPLNVYCENCEEKDTISVQIIDWGRLYETSQEFYIDIPNNNYFSHQNKNGI